MSVFKSPKDAFGVLDAETAASLVTAAADLVVVLDTKGVVRDVAVPDAALERELVDAESWRGQSWAATLSPASRTKAAALLHDTGMAGPGKWRHLNHPGRDGREVPMLYSALTLPGHEHVFVFGRDMRQLTTLQQRLIDAQQSMERDYGKLRFLELRYRLLFQSGIEPVLMVNAASQKIVEANPATAALIGLGLDQLTGHALSDLFVAADRARVAGLLATTRTGAEAEPIRVHLVPGASQGGRSGQSGQSVTLSAALCRDETASFMLLRLTHATAPAAPAQLRAVGPSHAGFTRLAEQVPDGLVLTDAAGHVLQANAAFLALVELGSDTAAVGEPLDRWLGRAGIDLQVLLSNLRQRDVVRLFSTTLTGASGLATAIEVSAVRLAHADAPDQFGFVIRNVDRRVAEARSGRALPRSVDQLTELIGRVALKDLVREATDMIERLCIETALELTEDNRASAAELLGLSRQSLYVKLRRYGLGDLAEVSA